MGIGIGERGPGRRPTHTEMDQLAHGGRQAAADLAERVRAAHLTKQHRDEVIPAAEPLGRSLSGVLLDHTRKGGAIEQSQDLREAAGNGDHEAPPACGWHGVNTPWTAGINEPILPTSRRCFEILFWTRVLPTPLFPLVRKRLPVHFLSPVRLQATVRCSYHIP